MSRTTPTLLLLALVLLTPGASGLAETAGPRVEAAEADVPAKTAEGDTYSFDHQLGALIDEIFKCFSEHMTGMNDNIVLFDGKTELLDLYTNGTQPFVFEFETASRSPHRGTGGPSNPIIEINSIAGDDLFPEGFQDPESGTPLTDACVEIGIDDTLDTDPPITVAQANLSFNDGDAGSFDITSAFSDPWNGRLSIVFPGFAGRDIRQVRLMIEIDQQPLFSDGFETGNTASWSDRTP